MFTRMLLGVIPLLAIGTAFAQITSNPIAEPIVKREIAVEVKDRVRLPDTRGLCSADKDVAPAGLARVSYVRELVLSLCMQKGLAIKESRSWQSVSQLFRVWRRWF